MIERYAIGFDPGPTWCGVASASLWGARLHFEWGERIRSHEPDVAAAIARVSTSALVAVETPEGFVHQHARGAQLLRTAAIAGSIATLARATGRAVLPLSAQAVRRALCGRGVRGTPGDAHVKRALSVLVVGMPARSSTHVRDALAAAVVALLNANKIAGVA